MFVSYLMKRGIFLFAILISLSFAIAITSYAIENSTISDVSIRPLTIYYETFDGNTSEFADFNLSTLQDFPSVILEKVSFGKVVFLENLNFSQIAGEDGIVDLDSYFNISDNLVHANEEYVPYMNKSVEISLRNIFYDDPVIINGVGVCTTCQLISYGNGTFVFNTTLFEGPFYIRDSSSLPPVCGDGICESDKGETPYNCPADCGSPPDDDDDEGDSGGGGGDPITPTEPDEDEDDKADGFYVEPELLVVQMNKGEYFQRTVKLFNTGNRDLEVTVYLVGDISRFIFPEERSFVLEAGQTKELRYDIYVSRALPSDVYTGGVIFSATGNLRSVQDVILDIKDRYALFDIRAEVLKKYFFPGARVRANVSIINMGDLRNFDVELEYKIIDFDQNIYTIKKEDFAMYQTHSGIYFLDLPEDMPIGDYLFYARVVYPPENVSASAYDTITVEKVSVWTWLLLILILVLIAIYVIYRYRNYKSTKKVIKKINEEKEEVKEEKIKEITREAPVIPDEFS